MTRGRKNIDNDLLLEAGKGHLLVASVRKSPALRMKCVNLYRYIVYSVFFLCCWSFNAVFAVPEVISTHDIETTKGRLQVLRKQYKKGGFADYSVILGGKIIIPDTAEDFNLLSHYPSTGEAVYVVLQVITGGSACPAYYKIIDLSNPEILIKDTYANCSDIATVKYIEDDKIVLKIGGEEWVYHDGEIEKLNPTERDIKRKSLKKQLLEK